MKRTLSEGGHVKRSNFKGFCYIEKMIKMENKVLGMVKFNKTLMETTKRSSQPWKETAKKEKIRKASKLFGKKLPNVKFNNNFMFFFSRKKFD